MPGLVEGCFNASSRACRADYVIAADMSGTRPRARLAKSGRREALNVWMVDDKLGTFVAGVVGQTPQQNELWKMRMLHPLETQSTEAAEPHAVRTRVETWLTITSTMWRPFHRNLALLVCTLRMAVRLAVTLLGFAFTKAVLRTLPPALDGSMGPAALRLSVTTEQSSGCRAV